MTDARFPHVRVALAWEDDPAEVVSVVSDALRAAGVTEPVIAEFERDALSGDYRHLVDTVLAWVCEEGEDEPEPDDPIKDDEW